MDTLDKSGHLKSRCPDKHTDYFISSASETVETSSFRLYFRFEVHLVFSTMRYVPAARVFGNGKSKVPGLFTESFAVTGIQSAPLSSIAAVSPDAGANQIPPPSPPIRSFLPEICTEPFN